VFLAIIVLSACGGGQAGGGSPPVTARALRSYIQKVEPIRLGVNQLLEQADPILESYRAHRLSGQDAAAAMNRLEPRFAQYTVEIATVRRRPGSWPRSTTAMPTPIFSRTPISVL
jgi:hypothetical protein